jgi:prolyl-tRNA editing enzyme YbaK/EbsC (Cys-tRNA(Pro) deacylase)
MSSQLPESARRVQEALDRSGLPFRVVEMPASTRTAKEAAAAIGCTVAQIAKSILFRGAVTGKPILVVASGVNRVNEEAVAALAGEPLEKASPEFVRESTGYAIGGVPPGGFSVPIATWIDQDLLQFEEVWAAAGTPFAVFSLDPRRLPEITGGAVARVCST